MSMNLSLRLASALFATSLASGAATQLDTSFAYNVTSTDDNITRPATAQVTRLDNFGAERRPVVVMMPGWGGVGDVGAVRDAQSVMFANAGYVAVNIGFHQTSSGMWYSDLAESAKAALDAFCTQAYADCSAVVLVGESYGGIQTHPVLRYLRATGSFDGSGGANAGRRVVGILGQDSGYALYYFDPVNADATQYSIAMIQNLGDGDFPVDTCDYGNCGARNRADYHQNAAGSQYVLSQCPAGGVHGSRGYADWDAWVLSAVKTMLHVQRGVPTFSGYAAPSLAVSNACVTNNPDPAADSDGDGMPNGVEVAEGRNPLVKDNDVFGNARLFAMQQYRDFLGREGDAAGIQGWTNLVAAGTYSRPQVIDAFVQSPEFGGFVAPVVRLYFATFLRVPDYAGLTFNAGLVRNGTVTLAQLADFFAASPEFAATYGALDNTAFVTLLYNNVLGRAPDPAGLSGWVGLLNGGMSRGQVLLGFSDSAEYQAAMANEVLVTMMYAAMLRRTPEPAGFNGWVGFLDAGTYTRAQVINGFFLSTEYRARFLP